MEASAAADALPADERPEVNEYDWKKAGGPALEAMLDDADLVDVGYIVRLIEAGGIVPRWQDLPDCAKITRANVWRMQTTLYWGERLLPLIVLSYPWLDRAHPDRQGEQLRRLLPLFKVSVAP